MTIREVRFYLEYNDATLSREMARTHFGVSTWLNSRLKLIRPDLRGEEVKGVNIVNFMCWNDARHSVHLNEWVRSRNTIEYNLTYDLDALVAKPPIENVTQLLRVASKLAVTAPWPQVRAIGNVLESPLNEAELAALDNCLKQWAASVGKPKK